MKYDIHIRRMCVYARHGVLPQERETGANFYISLHATANVDTKALTEDSIDGVVDYSALTRIIQDEMETPSRLLEHVAQRIGERTLREHQLVESLSIIIEKENPPLGISIEGIGVELKFYRT